MDWTALSLSLQLGLWTVVFLLPSGAIIAYLLAYKKFRGRRIAEAVLALPLVLPPTVVGYYLLTVFGKGSWLGELWEAIIGTPLVFSFSGLLLASLIANIPFTVQPLQRAFQSIPTEIRDAARCCGMSPWQAFRQVELPLIWPGIVTAVVLTFAHTLGEFGIVLMVGGNIPGETKTISIAIYDRVQAFDEASAGVMSIVLLGISFIAIVTTFALADKMGGRHG